MQEAMKHSPESPELKELAKKKLTSLIGSIRQKRRLEEDAKAAKESHALRPSGHSASNFAFNQDAIMNRQAVSRQTNGGRIGE